MNEELRQQLMEQAQLIAAMQGKISVMEEQLSLTPDFSDAITDIQATGMGYDRFNGTVSLTGNDDAVQGGTSLNGGTASTSSIIGASVWLAYTGSTERATIATANVSAGTITIVKAGLYVYSIYGNVAYDVPDNASPTIAKGVIYKNNVATTSIAGTRTDSVKMVESGLMNEWKSSGIKLVDLVAGDVIKARFEGRMSTAASATAPSIADACLSVLYVSA